jgi:predicted nucleotidyltransferase component of viral defense system
LAPYERIDGSKVNVLVLSPEDLVMEKIETYKDRKAYKDLYDITVLLNNVKEPNKIKKVLSEFSKNIPVPDEKLQSYSEFNSIIYAGPSPSFEKMSDFIKRWVL